MAASPITQAVIIAAGNGSRLKRHQGDDTPKPLRKLLGMPLLERVILSAKKAGIEKISVVVGYQAEKIKKFVESKDFGLEVALVHNPDWQKKNGVSALKARETVGHAPFMLLMADHIFDPAALEACRKHGVRLGEVTLAVDSRVDEVDDLEDATKVVCDSKSNCIFSIGKTLDRYDAIDTGIFACTPALFDVLEKIDRDTGDCSLSDGMQVLASAGKLKAWVFPADRYWQDVDTPQAWKIAEKKLLRSCIKSTDGAISRNFNRPISLFITRYLMRTGMSANTATGLISLIGASSGVVVARGGYWGFLIGAILFKLASILDGCDGEMSRLRFTSSKLGQWLDTASDNLTYLFFFTGVAVTVYRDSSSPAFPYLIGSAVFGVGMLLFLMFVYVIRYTKSGSLVSIQSDLQKTTGHGEGETLARAIIQRVGFMIKRDFFALLFLVFAIFGKGEWIFYAVLVGSNVAWLVLFNVRRFFESPAAIATCATPNFGVKG